MYPNKFFRFSTLILLVGILTACSLPLTSAPTSSVSDSEMATRVAKILTEMPSPTSALPTGELPPVITEAPQETETPMVITATAGEATPVTVATETPIVVLPTATATTIPATPTTGLTQVPEFTPPPDNPRSKLGTADWTDNMDDSTFWPTGPDTYTSIDFSNGKLKLTGLTTTDGWRLASTEKLNNFYLEMTVSTGNCSGNDRYGFIFRVPVLREANKGYLFGFSCDGKYSLREWDATIGSKGQMTTHINWTSSSAIQSGSNKTNTMGVMAVGDRIILYANGVMLSEVKDATFTEGNFGLFIGARDTNNFSIFVDEMAYWKNPTP